MRYVQSMRETVLLNGQYITPTKSSKQEALQLPVSHWIHMSCRLDWQRRLSFSRRPRAVLESIARRVGRSPISNHGKSCSLLGQRRSPSTISVAHIGMQMQGHSCFCGALIQSNDTEPKSCRMSLGSVYLSEMIRGFPLSPAYCVVWWARPA